MTPIFLAISDLSKVNIKYQMLPHQEHYRPKFHWGVKKGTLKDGVQFYNSFTYDGVDFSLYDCVYMCRRGELEPDIGKLVKLWETAARKRVVKVVWFFRPAEVTHWLGGIKLLDNELLLASGEGKGLSNCNPVEAITGKCNVVCLSTDRRNPKATDEEIETANFVFYRTFDVKTCAISEEFPNSIAKTEVGHFFNKGGTIRKQPLHHGGKGSLEKPQSSSSFGGATTKTAVKDGQSGSNTQSRLSPVALVKQTKSSAKDVAMARMDQCSISTSGVEKELKKDTISLCGQGREGNISVTYGTAARTEVKHSYCTSPTSLSDSRALKKRKLQDSLGPASFERHKVMKSMSQVIEVTTRVKEGASRWFKEQPWDERIKSAQVRGTLLLLENLDPSYTSAEVEDIVWDMLKQKVSAKMVQHNAFSNPLNGKAFVIFKSSEAAEIAISELKKRCLILGDRRPVVARRETIVEPVKGSGFAGHLSIGKIKFQKLGEDMRKAVSTSHYSQSNTIEHEMAIEWRVLQETSHQWWKALHEKQAAEIESLRSKMNALS